MREVVFLREHAEKWQAFEAQLRGRAPVDPDRLAELFVQLTDDLAYARTFYPQSETTRYLNDLAAEVHQTIYRNRREPRGRVRAFWQRELPAVMAEARVELLVAFVVFVLALGVGVLSATGDGTFARLILGDAYVNMTLANIEKGDPMAVYKQVNELDMFLAITFNNVRVSFFAFVMGLLASVGTAYVLFSNGVMLGAFHAFFYEHGLLGSSLLVVYIHGTLELSAVVLAGCAGFVMGNSLLFPGTYTRRASFRRGARRGLKIIVGLVPVFVAAGFLEGFVTRHTEMPAALSLCIIVGSLSFIVWYFVLYPFRVAPAGPPHTP